MIAPDLTRRIRDGERVLGAFCDLGSAVATEIVAGAGFDYVVIDLEHGYGGRGATVAQLQAATTAGTPALVRVPSADSDAIGWSLDMGASGIVVPRVESAAEAARAERRTRYAARRGLAPGARAAGYGRDAAGYLPRADADRLLVIQIETREALEAADEIAALGGVDVLFVGPADLGRTLGVAGGASHPELQAAAREVAAAARRAARAAGVYLDDPATIPAYAELGFTMLASGFEAGLLAGAASARADAARERLRQA
ncbi:MAG TPA: aldolase/citrate lyase family protein [Solirubrobacteraceae bacterium]|nr:aldolase/citrate lyase family protein [Solirubrobacteraceae bacterium]